MEDKRTNANMIEYYFISEINLIVCFDKYDEINSIYYLYETK